METKRTIIIGGGLSGLAAALRLSQFGEKVTVFERLNAVGGLNGSYVRNGRRYDIGLHAMTNLSRPEDRRAPLNLLLRKLGLERDALELCPQKRSAICFPTAELVFDNDIATLTDSVAQAFPAEADRFRRLVERLREMNPFENDRGFRSALPELAASLGSRQLRDMLLLPVMYYGNSCADDMDFRQFCILFRSLFLEGMGRPAHGIMPLLELLQGRLQEQGGEVRLNCSIDRIEHDGSRVTGVIDGKGVHHQAERYLSCIGGPETGRLLSSPVQGLSDLQTGGVSFVELQFILNRSPRELGMMDGIQFRNQSAEFVYRAPSSAVSVQSLVLCVPENFKGVFSREVRVTMLASYDVWSSLDNERYRQEKTAVQQQICALLDRWYPGFAAAVTDCEMYTPKTFARFTRRLNGAIYGMPHKHWDGGTPLDNLFLCGTDQGYLGIVGAMLSGMTMAYRLVKG